MADLVNDTHKSALGVRNQEPSHLDGGSYETLGGPKVGGEQPNTVKINSGAGVQNGDSTIPKAVGPEASHLKTEGDEPDVDFGDGIDGLEEADDIDAALDKFEEADVDIDLDDIKEEDDKDDDEVVKEGDENPFAKDDDKEDVKEDFPFKKDDDDKEDVKEAFGDDDDKDEVKEDFGKDDDDKEKVDEEDDKDDEKKIAESFKVRVKLPKLKLNESVIPAKNQKRVSAIFEEALRRTTKQVNKQLASHYRKIFESKLAKRDAVMAKKMDAYLSYVVEEWVKQNRVSLRQSMRAQLAEEFLDGLQRLFKEHYIDVPESKIDVVKKLTEQNEKLRKNLNEQHTKAMQLRRLAESANKARIVADFSRGLAESQASKLAKLAENVAYKSAKDFRAQLSVLKETHFVAGKTITEGKVAKTSDGAAEKVVIAEEKKQTTTVDSDDPTVKAIADTLSRQAKQNVW